MADLPTSLWGGWIVIVTVVTLIGMTWLVLNIYFSREAPEEKVDIENQVWDETLREGAAPAPLWWFWLMVALLVTTVVYLALYPGLGTFRGALQWSQGGQIAASRQRYEERFGAERMRLAQAPIEELREDATAMESASHIFNIYCAACHGEDAAGQAALFPDLTDDVWQWGAGEQQLAQTITAGRRAVMPPWQSVLQDQGVAQVTEHVLALAAGDTPAADESEGARLYRQYCTACHGADGAGVPMVGGPALNDGAWLYGSSQEAVRTSIAAGRNGVMPPFGARLDATQIRLLTAWLSGGAAPPP